MKLTLEGLRTSLSQGLRPAYLISGDEPLLVSEAADAVRERARGAGFDERDVYFIERAADWPDVLAGANNLSLFGSRKLLELRYRPLSRALRAPKPSCSCLTGRLAIRLS